MELPVSGALTMLQQTCIELVQGKEAHKEEVGEEYEMKCDLSRHTTLSNLCSPNVVS